MGIRICFPNGMSIEEAGPFTLKENEHITYARVSSFVDSGSDHHVVYTRFRIILNYCKEHDMLTEIGKQALKDTIDDSFELHHRMFNNAGNDFIKKEIDYLLSQDNAHLVMYLASLK